MLGMIMMFVIALFIHTKLAKSDFERVRLRDKNEVLEAKLARSWGTPARLDSKIQELEELAKKKLENEAEIGRLAGIQAELGSRLRNLTDARRARQGE